jgi:hypothetical protein
VGGNAGSDNPVLVDVAGLFGKLALLVQSTALPGNQVSSLLLRHILRREWDVGESSYRQSIGLALVLKTAIYTGARLGQ